MFRVLLAFLPSSHLKWVINEYINVSPKPSGGHSFDLETYHKTNLFNITLKIILQKKKKLFKLVKQVLDKYQIFGIPTCAKNMNPGLSGL